MHSSRRGGIEGEGFDRLLEWLDPDRERAGERYELLRRKLLKFFEWHGLAEASELTDHTLDRVAEKVCEGAERREGDPSPFFYGVARNILKEHWANVARRRRAEQDLGTARASDAGRAANPDTHSLENRLVCLERCLSRLTPSSREMILAYYKGTRAEKIRNRKALAERLGVPMNALWIRSHRLRLTLERCIETCLRGRSLKSIDGGDQ